MKRFKKILFVADGNKGQSSALKRAVSLAIANKARLTLIDVLDLEDESALELDPDLKASISKIKNHELKQRRAELTEMKRALNESTPELRVSIEVHAGRTAVSIIRSVLQKRHDLVIKVPESDRSGLSGVFGTGDLKLMRKCPCPVWIDKPSRKKTYSKILAAVDLNPVEPETESLAREIMENARALAEQENSELHVAHVWRLAGETTLRGRQITPYAVDKLLSSIKLAHKRELDALLEKFPFERTKVHLVKGIASDVIPTLVSRHKIDLVVIGTVGRSGIPGFFIGNTAEKILNTVDCSVLTLKPEGFETPIKV